MKPSRLQAIEPIHLEAPLSAAVELCWFYGELCGLSPVGNWDGASVAAGDVYCFRSSRIELRIALSPSPRVFNHGRRMTVAVPDLEVSAAMLSDRGYTFSWVHGINFTDRRLSLLDPGRNRVELRRSFEPL